jgi:hypothetical protein
MSARDVVWACEDMYKCYVQMLGKSRINTMGFKSSPY